MWRDLHAEILSEFQEFEINSEAQTEAWYQKYQYLRECKRQWERQNRKTLQYKIWRKSWEKTEVGRKCNKDKVRRYYTKNKQAILAKHKMRYAKRHPPKTFKCFRCGALLQVTTGWRKWCDDWCRRPRKTCTKKKPLSP